jgi:hypothetical protein
MLLSVYQFSEPVRLPLARDFHFYQVCNERLAPVDKKNRRAGAAEATLSIRRA